MIRLTVTEQDVLAMLLLLTLWMAVALSPRTRRLYHERRWIAIAFAVVLWWLWLEAAVHEQMEGVIAGVMVG